MLIPQKNNASQRGFASVSALVVVTALLGISAAMLALSASATANRNASAAEVRAFAAANSGLSHTLTLLRSGKAATECAVTSDAATPEAYQGVHLGTCYYWTSVWDNGDDTYTVRSTGSSANARQAVEVVVELNEPSSIYDNAIYAGNLDEDPLYQLELGGFGTEADEIEGDIYSGGGVLSVGDATVSGTIRATDTILGALGQEEVELPAPDLAAMSYETTADFDVAALFAGATFESDDAGGSAWQVPEENPAHIFRLNPDDRTTETAGTAKDDYFLEDPYETLEVDKAQDGSNPYRVTLGGADGNPGKDGNGAVYFIDGNLWFHNKSAYSLQLYQPDATGLQMTIVVKGNIYVSDNVFLGDDSTDGLALIAMKDDKVTDSGNIYFGDPTYGTLNEMHAFMYAENDFYDQNLDKTGSSTVKLVGNMTAGNQVLIERDYLTHHTKLMVDFDDRVSTGALELPGLPGLVETKDEAPLVEVLSWRRVVGP